MKFAIFAFVAFWFAKFATVDAALEGVSAVDLKALGFVLWGHHASSGADKSKCPLGTLPHNVFMHKTVHHNGVHFTWVKPVHGLVNGLTCGTHDVWKGEAGELLVDFHFFGKTDGAMLVHLEHLTKLGGVAHVYLKFVKGDHTPKILGFAPFLKEVHDLVGKDFLGVKGLPAFALFHELAFHSGLGLAALPAQLAAH